LDRGWKTGTGWARHGDTERGYEIFTDSTAIVDIWDKLVEDGVMPCSFAALDKVRIEAGLLFYGYYMSEANTPGRSGSASP